MAITAISQVGGLLQVEASLDDTTVGLPTLGAVMHVSQHDYFVERYRRLDGDVVTVPAAMIALGYGELSDDVAAVREAFSGRVPITYIILGRRSVGDPTWAVALTAIKAVLDVAKETVVHVLSTTRVESQQRELAAACPSRGWLFHFYTPSNDVRTNALGSLDKLIRSDGSVCNMVYYDPTGQSAAAAPSVTTPLETYNLTGSDESALSVTTSMAVQQDLDEPSEATFTVGKAVLVGSNAGPFVGVNGQKFVTGVDDLGPFEVELQTTPAVMDSLVENFVLADGMVAEWIVNGVTYSYVIAAANYGGSPGTATAAQVIADAAIPAPMAAALGLTDVAGKVRATTVRSGSTASVIIGPNADAAWVAALGFPAAGASGTGNVGNLAAYTATEIVNLTRAASGLRYPSVTALDHVQLASYAYGTGAKVTIYAASTAGLLTALGLAVGVTAGTGHAVNGAAVTAAELYTRVALLAGPTVAEADGAVTITGTKGIGKVHYLYLVGPLADVLGIGGTYFGPGVENDWADYRWVGERAGLALDASPPDAGHLTWHNVSADGLYGDRTLTVPEQQRLNRIQNVNVFVLLNADRGPEFADGRLSISFASGSPTYVDQWIAVRWLALYMARVFKANMDSISDGNDQLGFADETAYTPFVLSCVEIAEGVAVGSRCLAFVDTSPPTASKPTGVIVVPKAKLSPTLKGLRIGQVKVRAKLSSALHGMLVQIVLNT